MLALTIDQVLMKRRKIVHEMCENLVNEVEQCRSHLSPNTDSFKDCKDKLQEVAIRKIREVPTKDPQWFNDDNNLQKSIQEALEAKNNAMDFCQKEVCVDDVKKLFLSGKLPAQVVAVLLND